MKVLNKILLSVVLLGGLALATNLFAQQADDVNGEKEPVQQEAEKQTVKPSKAKPKKAKSSERVFKPSEEISADSPVPFPVDI